VGGVEGEDNDSSEEDNSTDTHDHEICGIAFLPGLRHENGEWSMFLYVLCIGTHSAAHLPSFPFHRPSSLPLPVT
jgi:hypothetical protein